MITTIKLINMSITSYSYLYVDVVRTLKIYSLSKFQVCNTALFTILTVLYIRSPELIYLITETLYSLADISPFPPPSRLW